MSKCRLSISGVAVTLGTGDAAIRALSDVSLDFPDGMLTLIMGPSGSGKTTLLSVLGCLLKPQDGAVLVNGDDVTNFTEQELTRIRREQIGFVFQSFRLFDSLTAIENVMFAMELSGRHGREVRFKAESHLDALGISSKRNLKPSELSGGEKQKVAIARALMRDPDILLADEPTASLDSTSGQSVTRILKEVAERNSCTVVVVSHDERLTAFARNIVELRDGKVVEPVLK